MEYDYASDLWSFGLVILEAALGHYPYPESKSTVGYVSIVADGEVPATVALSAAELDGAAMEVMAAGVDTEDGEATADMVDLAAGDGEL